jgi:hypothetical protein
VSTCNRFVLRDGCPLHIAKRLGAGRDYHENTKNTGLVQVIIWHKGKECMVALALSCECNSNGYICVIGEVTDYYDMKEIIVFDVCPVSSRN